MRRPPASASTAATATTRWSFGGAVSNASVDFGTGSDTLTLGNFANTLTISSAGTITGGTGADTITLGAAANNASIDLGAGNDKLTLAAGGNTVSVANVETITGGSGTIPLPWARRKTPPASRSAPATTL